MNIKTYKNILETLKAIIAGTEYEGHLFAVGGCEREFYRKELGQVDKFYAKDIDLVVNMPNGGINFAKWLEANKYTTGSIVTYENFGTAMFHLKDFPDEELEVVQTRKESYRDSESRNPETCYGNIMDDCKRRDFTINAIYYNITTGEHLDLTGNGIKDIKDKIVRSCDDPDIIFKEDPLRIMRAVRFCSKMDYTIEINTLKGIKKNAERLSIVSQERITDEFVQIMMYDPCGLIKMKRCGILDVIAPELSKEYVEKTNILNSLNKKYSYNSEEMLTILTMGMGHENAKAFLKRMNFSNEIIKYVLWRIDNFSNLYNAIKNKDYYLIHKIQYGAKKLEFPAVTFDSLIRLIKIYYSTEYKMLSFIDDRSIDNPLYFLRYFTYCLPVNGNDVMKIMNIPAGPQVKEVLDKLLDKAFYNRFITYDDCVWFMKHNFDERPKGFLNKIKYYIKHVFS